MASGVEPHRDWRANATWVPVRITDLFHHTTLAAPKDSLGCPVREFCGFLLVTCVIGGKCLSMLHALIWRGPLSSLVAFHTL